MAIGTQPSYGREYKAKAAILADWIAKKDFTVTDYGPDMGRQINVTDADAAGIREVNVRYCKLTKVCVLVRKGDTWVAR